MRKGIYISSKNQKLMDAIAAQAAKMGRVGSVKAFDTVVRRYGEKVT
jgi:hypothetical protein